MVFLYNVKNFHNSCLVIYFTTDFLQAFGLFELKKKKNFNNYKILLVLLYVK